MSLVARADLDFPVALFALDEAAPVELALAPLLDFGLHRRVAATAAHLGAAPGVRGPKSFNFMLELRRRHSN